MTILAWPLTAPFYPEVNSTGGPLDTLATFEPDVGAPIQRARSTAVTESWSLQTLFQTLADLAVFEDWWANTLGQGASRFIWRHPQTNAVRWVRIPQQYDKQFLGGGLSRVSFAALYLPGTPWFAPYVPTPYVRVPRWVAHYTAGVYGVGATRGVAADLNAVSGTFEVWRKKTDGTQTFLSQTYTAGSIPTTAPTGVEWLVGFDL